MPASLSLPPRICATCGTEFQPAHKRAKYCSKPCLWKSKNDRQRATRPDAMRAHARASYARHREKRVAYMRDRIAAQPEKYRGLALKSYWSIRINRPWASLILEAKRRATKKGLAFDLTEEWARSTWTGACSVSGLPFAIGQKGAGPKQMSPSIDRIEPSKGYLQSNCRFVLSAINSLKAEGDDLSMYRIAEAILGNRKV